MNDFTKKELSTLLNWGMDRAQAIGRSEFDHEGSNLVYAKIQSLIDAHGQLHCDHKIHKQIKACILCGLPSHYIPCAGGWL